MAYQVPPHTDQFYPTDIPRYYNNTKSQLDILKEHPAYSYFDASKVTFDDLGEDVGAMYQGDKDLSILNTLYTNPQNIKPRDLEYLGHETVHRTLDEGLKGVLPLSTPNYEGHGIPEAIDLLYGPLEARMNPDLRKSLKTSPYLDESDLAQTGPKRAYPNKILPFRSPAEVNESVPSRTEHLLNYTLDNMIYGDETPLHNIFPSNYDQRFINEIAGGHQTYSLPGIMYGARKYYSPRNAFLGNAPGEVRRGITGLKDTFKNAALKYIDIMKNYEMEQDRQGGQNPSAQSFRSAPGGLTQAQSRAARGDPKGTGGGWKWADGGLATMFERRR